MALFAANDVACRIARKTDRSQCHALVQLDPTSYVASLPNNDPSTVVDEESGPDGGPRVNVYPGTGVRQFGHHAGQQRHFQLEHLMGQAVNSHRLDTWIAKDNLLAIARCRITRKSGLDILFERLSEAG